MDNLQPVKGAIKTTLTDKLLNIRVYGLGFGVWDLGLGVRV
jgi:hypothetical protein